MSLTDVLTHAATALGGAGGLFAYLRSRESRAAAAHTAVAAQSAEVTARHHVAIAGIELTEETLRTLLSRVAHVETALRAEQDARVAERDLYAERVAALTVRATRAEERAEAAERLINALRAELEDLRAAALSQVSPRRASDPPEES